MGGEGGGRGGWVSGGGYWKSRKRGQTEGRDAWVCLHLHSADSCTRRGHCYMRVFPDNEPTQKSCAAATVNKNCPSPVGSSIVNENATRIRTTLEFCTYSPPPPYLASPNLMVMERRVVVPALLLMSTTSSQSPKLLLHSQSKLQCAVAVAAHQLPSSCPLGKQLFGL